jgi:hypothetical protein
LLEMCASPASIVADCADVSKTRNTFTLRIGIRVVTPSSSLRSMKLPPSLEGSTLTFST